MDDNILQEIEQLLGQQQNTAHALGIEARTIRRYHTEPEKIPLYVVLACKLIKHIFKNLNFLLTEHSLSKEEFLLQLTSTDIPHMTSDQFKDWMHKNNLDFEKAAELLGVSTVTTRKYGSDSKTSSSPIPKVVYLATEYYNISRLPFLIFTPPPNR